MSALDRLKEKIEIWKGRIDELERENSALREQVEQQAAFGVTEDEDVLQDALEACRQQVAALEHEMAEKDQEIEAIIAKVEAMIA